MTAIRRLGGKAQLDQERRLLPKAARRKATKLRLISMLAAALAIPSIVRGQTYDHTTFVHGFASDSSMWSTAYPDLGSLSTPLGYLASALQLKTFATPSLDQSARYSTQIATLGNRLVLAGGLHILVAHSLGSLESRGEYIDNPNAQPRYRGIVAIAPPHQGVIIADSAMKMRSYMGDLQRRMNDAVPGLILAADVYTYLFVYAWSGTSAGFPLLIPLNFFIQDKTQPLNLTTFFQMTQIPALADLSPSSPVIAHLNSSTTDGPLQRAQVIGSIPVRYAAIRLLQSAMNDDAGFSDATKKYRAGIVAYRTCKYFDYATILGWTLGRRCGFAARALRRLDDRWTSYVNGNDAFGRPSLKAFDGVVPNDHSVWPGSAPLQFQKTVPGVNHLNIYKTQLGLSQVKIAMQSVGASPVSPPPNGITGVSVTGPTRVNGCQAGTWTATVTGGIAPINYTWTVETTTISTGTSRTLSYTNAGSAPSIFVKVTAMDVNYTQATSNSFKTNLTLPGSC